MNKQLLQTRLSIIMVRENYNFLTSLGSFVLKLKNYFNEDYTQDEIENALHKMEENFIVQQFEEEQEHHLVEIPEDYNF